MSLDNTILADAGSWTDELPGLSSRFTSNHRVDVVGLCFSKTVLGTLSFLGPYTGNVIKIQGTVVGILSRRSQTSQHPPVRLQDSLPLRLTKFKCCNRFQQGYVHFLIAQKRKGKWM